MQESVPRTEPGDNHKQEAAPDPVAERMAGSPPEPQAANPPEPQPEPEAADPFDPANMRMSQDFASELGVRKVITTVRCDKPNRHTFVRVRSGEEWKVETYLFEDKVSRDRYYVDKPLVADLLGEVHRVCLHVTITKQGDLFLWPVKLPGPDGRRNEWNDSALEAAKLAEERWVRMAANMAGGHYDVFEAVGELAEPEWPELTLKEILRLCFQGRFIDSVDHPCLKALRGEV